ncbi:L,D-transpeptidase family protein [Pontibacter indicus]|uniref:Murein L,D-transpeptidase YcbB/YkuD n=1 Tax=Pontibacter indicus TaxID=1317125 RepID=A0A1R3WQV9_9BACT|nr:L,D-transpeptidase family protein [Pontibacter indicus]SIT79890.1 Murein L,D-transpeptidase YcbB/YkuD [Pontibacter indicus]
MNPYNLQKFKPIGIALLCLFGLASCNKSGDSKKENGGVKEMLGLNTVAATETDSLYIRDYISQHKQFKEHEDLIYLFYGDRDYRLGWFKGSDLVAESEKLLSTLDNASQEGLDPKEYKVVAIDEMISQYNELGRKDSARLELQQQIDIALTATYFNYASDFYRGRIDPRNVKQVQWGVRNNKIKLHKALQTILRERESTYPYYEFEALHKGYSDLRDALQKYRELEEKGGWAKVELGNRKMLVKGDTAAAVVSLRQRLNLGTQINAKDPAMRKFDDKLEAQVKAFQELHGIVPDGKVGGNTLRTMNVPVEDRIQQIMMNMERWRWIPKRLVPKSLDQKYIWVNIPEYKLYVYEDPSNSPEAEREYKKTMEMNVIVGKTMHSTPIFSDRMEYVVLAPYWNVPNSIVEKEIAPGIMREPGYLDRQNMEVVTKERNPKQVDPGSIDWSSVTEKNFPYMVRQRPGPKNSLGTMKFLFPNEHAVYLHDTPTGSLFSQTQRGFSHGCVRLERPMDLAKYVLKDMPEWNESRIEETINGGEEVWITLPKKVQVYLVYFTSWVDEDGNVHFRDDIYGHDKRLEQELFS